MDASPKAWGLLRLSMGEEDQVLGLNSPAATQYWGISHWVNLVSTTVIRMSSGVAAVRTVRDACL